VTPIDRIVMTYRRTTHAGAPASAPDISPEVRTRLLLGVDHGVWIGHGGDDILVAGRASFQRHHSGGIVAGMDDASVR
jgi:hypothetical protein